VDDLRVGAVAALPLSDGGWGACQVTGLRPDIVTVLALAWHADRPPTLAQLDGAGPLTVDHHGWAGTTENVNLDRAAPLPSGLLWLGSMPVPPGVAEASSTFSTWAGLAAQVVAQHRWDTVLPAEVRAAYRAADPAEVVRLDLGGGSGIRSLPATTFELDLSDLPSVATLGPAVRPVAEPWSGNGSSTGSANGTGPGPGPGSGTDTAGGPAPRNVAGAAGASGTDGRSSFGPMRWNELDRLPRCTTLIWSGPDRGLTAALAAHPIIERLVWHDALAAVDLAATGLTALTFSGRPPVRLALPRAVHTLELTGSSAPAVVTVADDGRWLRLRLDLGGDLGVPVVPPIPAGLHRVRDLDLAVDGTLSVAPLRALEELEALRIAWDKGPGRLVDTGALAGLRRLASIELVDGHAIGAGDLPDLPGLTHLSVSGLPRQVADDFRARYRGSRVNLQIRGLDSA
jgi:hypothetical protein